MLAATDSARGDSLAETGRCHALSQESGVEEIGGAARRPDGLRFFAESGARQRLARGRFEDMALQLEVADAIYREVLGLSPPLTSPRYRRAGFIAVLLRDDAGRGGQAFDEVVRSDEVRGCHIRMALGGRVVPAANTTPAHELFHLYLNAHTMFKQGWLQEGLARWSEALFHGELPVTSSLPADRAALDRLLRKRYGAAPFWQRLLELLDPQGERAVPDALRAKRYRDGSPVVSAGRLYNGDFLAHFLATLGDAGDRLAAWQQWPVHDWAEREQHSSHHDRAILDALHRAISTYDSPAHRPDELRVFLQLIAPERSS